VLLQPLLEGGGQERGVRAGTVNVAGAVAMGSALRITVAQRADDVTRVARLRDRLLAGLVERIDGLSENGDRTVKVAGSCHVAIPGVEAEVLLVALDRLGLCAAAGSSCSSGATEPSHVLAAMGVPRQDAISSIRLSLGFASTDADVDAALELVPAAVDALRNAAVATP
jgi:cysteine desulfurase